MKQFLFFDLDGTLTDPGEGIINSILYSLEKLGIAPPARERLFCFIGPPLWESYEKYFGMTRAGAERAVALYREYYRERGIFENRVYPGIPALLSSLRAAGRTLLVATSKPVPFTERILAHFALDCHFDFVSGSELDGSRVNKDEVIAYALERRGIAPAHTLMVGDRKHDILGAQKNAVESVGVLYGYGSREELSAAGADHLAESVEELGALLGRL